MPRIPDRHLQSVVYIFPSEENAHSGEQAGGSGFVASYPSERGNWMFQYVVTNQHVVDRGGHWIRLNHAEGTHVVHIPPDDWVSAPDGDDFALALLDVPEHVKPYWLALDEGALTAEEVLELNVGPGTSATWWAGSRHTEVG